MFSSIKNRKLAAIALGLVLMSSVSSSAFAIACMDQPNATAADCEKACQWTLITPWVWPVCM